MRFTIRELLLMTVIVTEGVEWGLDQYEQSPREATLPANHLSARDLHSQGIASAGLIPASLRPLPANRLIARTVISWSQMTWQLSRMPVKPRAVRTARSASVIVAGSPETNSTLHVVQRALPPQACN